MLKHRSRIDNMKWTPAVPLLKIQTMRIPVLSVLTVLIDYIGVWENVVGFFHTFLTFVDYNDTEKILSRLIFSLIKTIPWWTINTIRNLSIKIRIIWKLIYSHKIRHTVQIFNCLSSCSHKKTGILWLFCRSEVLCTSGWYTAFRRTWMKKEVMPAHSPHATKVK